MIFTRILSLSSLVFCVVADFDKYQDAYTAIAASMTALDDAIIDITSDPSTISALKPLVKGVTDAVEKGIKTISAQPPLTSEDVSTFTVTTQMQLDGVALVVADLELKMSEIQGAKAKPAVLDIVKKLKDANKKLDAVILTKVPAGLKKLIQNQSADVAATFDECTSLFSM